MARYSGCRNNLFGWTITTIVSRTGNHVHLQLPPMPLTGDRRPAAGTIQGPFFQGADGERNQVRTVSVRAETDQISRAALRTLDATAKTGGHGKF
jgi:hypothetical protein